MGGANRKSLLILSFTLAVVMLGYGIILPILPFYIEKMGASGRELGMLTAVSALMQLIFAPLWGNLSDRVGRKPVLLIGVAGYGLTLLLFGLAQHLWMLFLARTLNGALASATLPTSMAFVSDNTPEKERGGGMGQLGAAIGAGLVLGPGLGGMLANVSLAMPFFIASALCVAALLLVWAFLPESLPAERRQANQTQPGFKPGMLRHVLAGPTGVLMLLILVVSFGMSSFQGILGLYALDKFGYTTQQIGFIWTVIGVLMIVSQGVLTGLLTKRFGEVWVIRISLLATAAGFGLILLAQGYYILLLATGFLILAIALTGPALNALISTRTELPQGVTMGVNNSFQGLGRVLGPLWAGWIFDLDQNLPFISSAAILFLAFIISVLRITQPKEIKNELPPDASGKRLPEAHQSVEDLAMK
jgi:DHA1 family multidrug resistance protein-like MFS transporter